MKLLFRGGVAGFCCFSFSPLISFLPCPMFPLKFACQNFHFVLLISYIN
jgi:hypothetical protein